MSLINPSIAIVIISSTALLTPIAILITNEYISNLKTRYTKIRDWIDVFTLLYEKTLKQSPVDKKIDDKEVLELKKNYNLYPDKRKNVMTKTSFKVEDVLGDVISKNSNSPEEKTKHKIFFAKIM